jgi:crotonobetainyl-CoA:carnitine CoA-transferase CaiB-like acyl-CoA transferase
MLVVVRVTAIVITAAGCAAKPAPVQEPAPEPPPMTTVPPRVDTVRVTVPDPDQQRRITELELRLLERDAQIDRLEANLEETRREVVRSLARLQTSASRAEAASALAEADIALQTLRTRAPQAPELAPARRLLDMSTAEFGRQNYGGALYLANQVKSLAASGRGRVAATAGDAPTRPGETAFAVPVPLTVSSRANVREGPGTTFRVLFTVERGDTLTGLSHLEDWVRVTDETGRGGWVFYNLVTRRGQAGR